MRAGFDARILRGVRAVNTLFWLGRRIICSNFLCAGEWGWRELGVKWGREGLYIDGVGWRCVPVEVVECNHTFFPGI